MTVLIAVETLVLVLLALLVAGLLRSHAEILRRLGPPPASPEDDRTQVLPPPREGAMAGVDIVGTTVQGDPVKVSVEGRTTNSLLAFLTSGCATCEAFWKAFDPKVRPAMPGGARLIVVTKDSKYESPSKLRALAPPEVPVVMSSPAWDAYGVPVSPYFIFVDGVSGQVRGEGTASTWPQVLSLLEDALGDASLRDDPAADRLDVSTSREEAGTRRGPTADEELRSAGIGAGHPSLYTAGDPAAEERSGRAHGGS